MNDSQYKKTLSMAITAIIAALAVSGLAVLVTIPPQQKAVAQQQNNTTTTTTTTIPTQSSMPASSNKTFYIFSAEVAEGFNETAAGVPGDVYSLPVIVVNKGDNVTVRFYNTEETGERHSFTINAQPYNVDIDTVGGKSGNATFTANQEGVFPYFCKYHQPTMTGQLVVLPSLSSQSAAAASQPAA